ncbi:S1C family serine protease [Plantactinospora soyae]|uniref:Serine protease PepD n=1 Tax=Plantactinospora soyae TaxID=1544732 RepID=A0A927M5K3_9ACTN|nr:trypsin-like peptidase domain-containing protein [Plantactinospora soyae]MBE1487196.1 putative serine protease PepD [Plantactinospora soyae]
MSDFETDPQRRPANADRELSHPTAGLPRDDRGQSDSDAFGHRPADSATPGTGSADPGTSGAADAGDRPEPPTATVTPAPGQPYGDQAYGSAQTAGQQPYVGAPAPGQPYGAHGAAQTSAAQPYSAVPASAQPYSGVPASGQPYAGAPAPGQAYSAGPYGATPASGQPYGAGPYGPGQASGQPYSLPSTGTEPATSPWQAPHGGQQPHQGWTGQPGQHNPGGGVPPHLGGPSAPPWAVPVGPPAPASGGRFGKFAAIGAAALALMVGSGIAGGAIALALDDGPAVTTRSYTAAPVINPAELPKIAAQVENSVVSISTSSAEGSGVVMSADGFMLTNNHVVASADDGKVEVFFADGKKAAAKVIGTDPKTDLAVVKADGVSGLAAAKFGDSDAMQVGDQVLALGSPLGLQGSVTAGIISARDRTIQAGGGQEEQPNPFGQPQQQQGAASSISGLLQTDAPINPGNSGGALVNTKAEVIGINTAIATAGQGTGNIGVGFAIPSNKAMVVAEALQRGEKVSHPSLGVQVTAAESGGALIAAVQPDSPAAKAGLQQGDVVTQFGDKRINDSDDLVGAVQGGKVGDQVQVTYTRNGAEKSATVTLAETS